MQARPRSTPKAAVRGPAATGEAAWGACDASKYLKCVEKPLGELPPLLPRDIKKRPQRSTTSPHLTAASNKSSCRSAKGQGEEAKDLPQSPADCAGSASTRQAATEPSAGIRERHHHIWQPFEVKAVAAVRNGREREPRIYLKVPQAARRPRVDRASTRQAATEPSAGTRAQRHYHI